MIKAVTTGAVESYTLKTISGAYLSNLIISKLKRNNKINKKGNIIMPCECYDTG